MKQYLKIIFTILIVTFTATLHSQQLNQANKNIINAGNFANEGYIDSAIVKYELAFSQFEYVHSTHVRKVLSLSKENKDKLRVKRYKRLLKEKKKCKNTQLVAKVDSILEWDGKIRKGYFPKQVRYYIECKEDSLCDKNSLEFQQAKTYYDSTLLIDSNNQRALLELLDKAGGYKGEADVGSKKEYGYFVLLLHYDTDTNNRILQPYLDDAFQKGYMTSLLHTYVLDRHEYYTMGTQTYWSWPLLDENPDLSKEEILKANERRRKIGISSRIREVKKAGNDWHIINE